MKTEVQTNAAPQAIGAYSQAIKADNLVFVSGQLPVNPETGEFAGNDICSQAHQSLKNIKAILNSVGADMENIVKTTVFLNSMDDFAAMNGVYSEYFTGACPARAAVEVSRLPKNALIEIEAIALI